MSSVVYKKGFTLIEILVTLSFVAVMIVMYQAVINHALLASTTKNKDLALTIAQNKIEGLRALGYTGLPVSGSFSDSLLASLPAGSGGVAVSDYNAGIKQAVVTVSWTESSGKSYSMTLTTLIVNSGGI